MLLMKVLVLVRMIFPQISQNCSIAQNYYCCDFGLLKIRDLGLVVSVFLDNQPKLKDTVNISC